MRAEYEADKKRKEEEAAAQQQQQETEGRVLQESEPASEQAAEQHDAAAQHVSVQTPAPWSAQERLHRTWDGTA